MAGTLSVRFFLLIVLQRSSDSMIFQTFTENFFYLRLPNVCRTPIYRYNFYSRVQYSPDCSIGINIMISFLQRIQLLTQWTAIRLMKFDWFVFTSADCGTFTETVSFALLVISIERSDHESQYRINVLFKNTKRKSKL